MYLLDWTNEPIKKQNAKQKQNQKEGLIFLAKKIKPGVQIPVKEFGLDRDFLKRTKKGDDN